MRQCMRAPSARSLLTAQGGARGSHRDALPILPHTRRLRCQSRPVTLARDMAVADRTQAVNPPLKWAGGKRWQVPYLLSLRRPHAKRRLVEPFCGGLAVALGLLPERAILNDANPHVINFYRWLQRGLPVDLAMENREQTFYRHRKRFNALLLAGKGGTAEAAGLFYYLNRTGFNGLCRFNSRGEFNVPFGQYQKSGSTDFPRIATFSHAGPSRLGMWWTCRLKPVTSCMRIRRTTWNSLSMPEAAFLERIKSDGGLVVQASRASRFGESGHRTCRAPL